MGALPARLSESTAAVAAHRADGSAAEPRSGGAGTGATEAGAVSGPGRATGPPELLQPVGIRSRCPTASRFALRRWLAAMIARTLVR
jgi:hypothetical protein